MTDAMVDLRSDTVTRPSKAMYAAMAAAEVGDDVLGDDPTTARLEEEAAEMLGKEAGLFVPTGTMGNLAAIITHASGVAFPEMISGNKQHTYLYEVGTTARLAGVHNWAVPNKADGTLALDEIENAIRIEDVHHPQTRLVILENTHNSCGGVPLPTSYVDSVGALTKSHKIALHIDGARIFNAATALGQPASRVCQAADSVTFCLSKGLGAPAGSVLVGSRDFIKRTRNVRKALGGGMRQSGVLAACGLVALREMTTRLAEDHEAAQILARGLAEMPGITIRAQDVHTNILYFDVADGKGEILCEKLAQDHGVLVGAYSTAQVRAVTHVDAPPSVMPRVLDAFRATLGSIFP
ncbi:Low specificity L-threonine aldolase [Hondaea fermentalgiana]|uniref:Low specificity L-threonine aldolase n=1 Tax=Hondaea fermentalgiana TaxID=2315210 RepID=A0A2R5GUG8_9STRA|nr:Low specificity L-threonine aldolase [Hondaea fermentalgiana]|eukprot:GBG34517.1 Low specificity L-threonine aldolase [Hondaea fermentalgiana]